MPRLPFTGSCHCGQTRYIVYYTLPHTPPPPPGGPENHPRPSGQRFYRCNCTPCQKAGILHTRVHDALNDFILIAPLDPLGPESPESGKESPLATYRCNAGRIAMLFCRTCGGRCFNIAGEGEVVEVNLAQLGVDEATRQRVGADVDERGLTKIWRPKAPFSDGQGRDYLSVNAYSLDAKQDGLDLREWVENKHVMYHDYLDEVEVQRYDRPFVGGAY